MGRWWPTYSGTWILLPSSTKKKSCPSWTPSDIIFWIRACTMHNKSNFLCLAFYFAYLRPMSIVMGRSVILGSFTIAILYIFIWGEEQLQKWSVSKSSRVHLSNLMQMWQERNFVRSLWSLMYTTKRISTLLAILFSFRPKIRPKNGFSCYVLFLGQIFWVHILFT